MIDKNYWLGYIRPSIYRYLAPFTTTQLTVYLWGFKAACPEEFAGGKKTQQHNFSLILYGTKLPFLKNMLEQYTGAAIMLLFAMGIACGMVAMTSLLGPKRHFADKMEPFECGESQLVSPHQRFSVKFYLVAVLFVLFDIEAIFFFPWAVLFKRLGLFGFVEMFLFILILGVGLLYVWKRGGLDWE